MNYPFQAGMLSGYRQNPSGALDPNLSLPNVAADDQVIVQLATNCPPPEGSLVDPVSASSNAYSGKYGLGSQAALGQKVRPFRRLITTQSIFRREVFQ
jgi:hypothetical protein